MTILISRQTGGIGDILCLTPTIRAIKEKYHSSVIVCTTLGYSNSALFDILNHNPWIDKVISVNELSDYKFKKFYNFGTGKELEIEAKTGANRIDIFAELANIKLVDKQTIYVITNKEKTWAKAWIKEKISSEKRRLIGIQVRTTSNKRDWGEEKALLLAFQIVNTWKDTSVLLFYEGLISERPKDYPNIHCIVGFPLYTVASLMNECECFVAPDSGLLHLAGALKTKIVGIFGSIDPKSRISYYQNAKSVSLYYPCSPCWENVCNGNHECMERIPVLSVIQKVGEHLGKTLVSKRNNNDILVIRRGGIGDLILLSNALRALKEQQSKSDIYLAVLSKWVPLFKGLPFLKDVFSFEEINQKGIFGTVYDLRMAVEPPKIGGKLDWKLYTRKPRSDNFEDLLGVKVKNKKFDVMVNDEAVTRIREKLVGLKLPIISILAGADCYFRNIPYELVLSLIDMSIYRLNASVVLLGTSREWCKYLNTIERSKVLNLINKTSPEELAAMISLSNLIIAPDTGTAHIGGALGKPTLVMVGNVPFDLRYAYYPTVRGVEAKVKSGCVPCHDALSSKEDSLEAKKFFCEHGLISGAPCLKSIKLEDVFEEVVNLSKNWKVRGRRN